MFNFFRQLCNNGIEMTVGPYYKNPQVLDVEFKRGDKNMSCCVDLSRLDDYAGDFNKALVMILEQYLNTFLMESKRAPEPYINTSEVNVKEICEHLTEHLVEKCGVPKEIFDPGFMDKAQNSQTAKDYVKDLEKRFDDAGILPMKLK